MGRRFAGLALLACVVLAGCVRPAPRPAAEPSPAPPPPVVARWAGGQLTRDRLEQRVRVMLASAGVEPGAPADALAARFRRQEVRTLVQLLLLEAHHRRQPRKLPRTVEEEVRLRWERAVRTRGRDTLLRSLRAWNVSEAHVQGELRLEALRDLYLEALAEAEPVGEEFVRADYDRNRHLYRVPDRYRLLGILTKTREEAERARAEILGGKAFGEVARKYSTDAATREKGGEVGWLEDTRMQPHLYQAVRKLRKGELSPVFAGPRGWYVVRLVDVRPGRPLRYEEARPLIVRQFRLQAARIELQALVSRLWKESAVQVYWPEPEPRPSPSPSP
jgi:hypothetical protein